MAKILRKNMKIFGSNAGPQQLGVFGSLAAGLPAFSTDPETIQSLSNYETGWYGAILGNNSPAIQDMNALQYLFAYQIAYLLQAGIAEWDDATEYFIGNKVTIGLDTYISLTDNNLNNDPLFDLVNWGREGAPTGVTTGHSGATAPRGYILASGRTIGNALSGATERANDDTFRLFNMYWSDYSDVLLPIQDSSGGASTRGVSALDDWNANKRMTIPDIRGRTFAGLDNMGGSAASRLTSTTMTPNGETLGASGGAQTHTLTAAQLAAHSHGSGTIAVSSSSGTHAHNIAVTSGPAGSPNTVREGLNTNSGTYTTPTAGGHTHTAPTISGSTDNNSPAGTAHNNTQPTWVGNVIIKL